MKKTVAVVVGTRPEAIKLAPVIRELHRSRFLKPLTISTSQHRHMVQQVFRNFGITIDRDLKVMKNSQTLWELSGRLASRLGKFFNEHPVSAALVQGDTSSAFFGGLCAFYHKIPVGHVEAGLRTGNAYAPFPEEMNRTLLGSVATWHFAPTRDAQQRLRSEGIKPGTIYLTGNTVVDALRWMASKTKDRAAGKWKAEKLVLVTCHRRENLGAPMQSISEGLAALARRNPELSILLPLHPNPAVRKLLAPGLTQLPNVALCEPMDYESFLTALQRAWLVISDSGGVQEEATALGKPVLVLRTETERQEGVKAGALKLIGPNGKRLLREAERLLHDPAAYRQMCKASKVFGDGRAAERIVRILEKAL